jgi:Ca2+-binding RTX toxin-like protein
MPYPTAYPSLTAKSVVLTPGGDYSFSQLFTYAPAVGNTGDTITYVGAFTSYGLNYTITGPAYIYPGSSGYAWTIEGDPNYRGWPDSFWGAGIHVAENATGSISLSFGLSLGFYYTEAASNWILSVGSGGGGTFSIGGVLFDDTANTVDFNALQLGQKDAMASGANIYAALGGDDVVILPNTTTIAGTSATWNFSTVFQAGSGNDNVTGRSGNDIIDGGLGNDTIAGGGGNDTIVGSPGTDTLKGDAGDDTFDYQRNGTASFALSTTQTLDGGSNSLSGRDRILLPGSPNDYTINTTIGSSWVASHARIVGNATMSSLVLNTTDVESVQFASALNNQVTLAGGNLYSELATLAVEAYSNSAGATIARNTNWHPVSAIELGMQPSSYGVLGGYLFEDGIYRSTSIKSAFPWWTESDVLVLAGNVGGQNTLTLAFRGTDEGFFGEIPSYYNMKETLDQDFGPLISHLQNYVADNNISQVLVTGHSLGSSMSQAFLSEALFPNERGVGIASPGAELFVSGGGNFINFIHVNDIINLAPKIVSGPIVWIDSPMDANPFASKPTKAWFDNALLQHDKTIYKTDILNLVTLATDTLSIFGSTQIAQALRTGSPYGGPSIQVMPGADQNEILKPISADNFVLGGNLRDQIHLDIDVGKQFVPPLSQVRIIDGGAGFNTLFVPYDQSDYHTSAGNVGGTNLVWTTVPIATLYHINVIFFGDGSELRLNNSVANVQRPAAGQVTLTVDPTFDYAEAGNAKLTITGSGQGDIISLGSADHIVNASAGDNTIFASDAATAGNFTLKLGTGNDVVTLGQGNDHINGGGGADILRGGAGSDTFIFDAAALASAELTPAVAHVVDYDQGNAATFSLAEGDQFDFSALSGGTALPSTTMLRAVVGGPDADAALQIDQTGAADGFTWITVTYVSGIHRGDMLNVIRDESNQTGVMVAVQGQSVPSDLGGDGQSDILWQNGDGAVAIWDSGQLANAHITVNAGLVPSSWHIGGAGDFDGNGSNDVLWQSDNGAASIWDNGQLAAAHIIANAGLIPTSWHIAGTGDFDGNGQDDILWQNNNGSVSVWDNGQIAGAHIIANAGLIPTSWHIAGTGDFDGNGQGDILWINDNGMASIWDSGQLGSAHLIANPGTISNGWHFAGAGDFDGNGQSDILWRNDSGATSVWDNGQVGRAHVIANAGVVPTSWHIESVGDYDGNGQSDILWRNDNGALSVWDNGLLAGAHIIATAGTVSSDWHIA